MTTAPGPGDAASVTVLVPVDPEAAFDAFTREIDQWWGHGPKFRCGGRRPSRITLEPGVGGRLIETIPGKSGEKTVEFGRITAFEPGERLALEWRGVNFKPGEKTLVEVLFRASSSGTLVTVRHSGWSALPEDHPARHGHVGADFSRFIGAWWAELMTSLRLHAGQA